MINLNLKILHKHNNILIKIFMIEFILQDKIYMRFITQLIQNLEII